VNKHFFFNLGPLSGLSYLPYKIIKLIGLRALGERVNGRLRGVKGRLIF
jgi:hypothetical protein